MKDHDQINSEMNEVKEACKLIVDYLQKKKNPYTAVVVTQESIRVLRVAMGMPNNNVD